MTTKVFLLNPPFYKNFSRFQRCPSVTKSGTFYYPLWLASATGLLEKNGYSCFLLDAPARGIAREQVYEDISSFSPDLVVLHTSTASIQNDIEIASAIKGKVKCKIVLVGTHVSVDWISKKILEDFNCIDCIARKEYEYTLLELAYAIENNKDFSFIKGLSYKDEKNIIINSDRALCPNLDDLPFVSQTYKKYLNPYHYKYSISRYPMMTIMTSRGCPFQCNFCLYPQSFTGHAFRVRSPGNVLEELSYIKSQFPYLKDIFFEDDTFTVDKNRVRKICDLIIKEKLDITWTANARADLDLDLLRYMKKAGCRLLCVGFESCNQEVLKNMQKNILAEKYLQFAKDAYQANVLIHGCFMLGNVGDTMASFNQTLEFAKQLPLSSAQFLPIQVYPGTELYEKVKNKGYLQTENYSKWVTDEGFQNSVVDYPNLSAQEIVAFCNRAKFQYHFRLRFVLLKLIESLKLPKEFTRNFVSMIVLLKNILKDRKRLFVKK